MIEYVREKGKGWTRSVRQEWKGEIIPGKRIETQIQMVQTPHRIYQTLPQQRVHAHKYLRGKKKQSR